jgi:outer membrane protein assembly factor BamB
MRQRSIALAIAFFLSSHASQLRAADQPQWGRPWSRNMVSDEKGLVIDFDPASRKNVKWVARLGSQSYGTPIVANGRVLIGTNNNSPRDPRHQGDRGVLMCLDERDGHLLWQLVVPKLEDDKYLDWPEAGFASTATVEGNRIYILSNRGEVLCLDLNGLSNGNDGPYLDEGRHMTPRGQAPMTPGPLDADIIWCTDLVSQAGIHTHDQVEGSVLIDGDLLYVNSCNGVDNTHRKIRCPDAPSLVVLDKHSGRIVAQDNQHIGPNIFHCTWASPSLGVVNGRRTIFYGGDDGVCYGFDALAGISSTADVLSLKLAWKFDTDPTGPKQDVHQFVGNRRQGPNVIMGMPVFDGNKIYVSCGGDLWWGKHEGWIKCINAAASGDVTRSGEVWSYALSRETCCTPAVYNGMVFATDCGGMIHCIDAQTGKAIWTHQAHGDFWASPMIADGKLYVGTRRGQFLIMSADHEKFVVSTIEFGEPISATVTAANGTLYVATMTQIYAIAPGTVK